MFEIIVCDDEEKDLSAITDMIHEILKDTKQKYHISAFQSASEMLDKTKKIDIAILDIVMPECNGIELGKKLKEKFPEAALIYTTSYEEYCNQAINKVHAFSFLVKPVNATELKEQILDCVQRSKECEQNEQIVFEKVRDSKGNELSAVQLNVKDILYCEYMKMKRAVAIVLENEVYVYATVFEKLSEQLESYGFAISCRGSIVNLSHIKKLKGYTIFLDNGTELPLTQKRVSEFKEKMNTYIHKKQER